MSPPFEQLADLVKRGPTQRRERRWQEELRQTVEAIAGLTAVDGATILTDRYELLAFGAKITRRGRAAGGAGVRDRADPGL